MRSSILLSAIVLVAIALPGTLANAQSAPQMKAQPQQPVVKKDVPLPAPIETAKVVLTRSLLSASNNWPEAPQIVTLSFQIRNDGTTKVTNIPWTIGSDTTNATLGQGTHPALDPGQSVTVSATWQAASGAHTLRGSIDPANVLKNTSPAKTSTVTLNVPNPGKHFLRVGLAGMGHGTVFSAGGLSCTNENSTSQHGTCFVEVEHGANRTLYASAAPSIGVGWSVECRNLGLDNNGRQMCGVTVNGPTAVSAAFAP